MQAPRVRRGTGTPVGTRMRASRRALGWAVVVAVLTLPVGAAAEERVAPSAAQVSEPGLVELRLTDGSVVYGTIQSETPERLVLKTIAGAILEVERSQIVSLQPARGDVVNGEFQRADANTTRLLFSPTARSLRKGEGYIGIYEFVLPFVQFGLTDRLSMGVGTPLVFYGDESGRPFWLTPKYQFYRDPRTSAAVGVMHFFLAGKDTHFGIAYAVATFGGSNRALTVGTGWAYARYKEDEYDPSSCLRTSAAAAAACGGPRRVTKASGSPLVMLGGERRLNRRVKLITENYGFKQGALVSAGVRFLGDRLSADLGVLSPVTTEGGFLIAPVVNFVWTFGT